MGCSVVKGSEVQCSKFQYCVFHFSVMHCDAVQCSSVQFTLQTHLPANRAVNFSLVRRNHTVVSGQFTVYTVYCPPYTLHQILYTIHCTVYTIHCIMYTIHCTVYTVYCKLYNVHFTLYTVYRILFNVNRRGNFGVSTIFVNPDSRLKPTSESV